MNLKLHLKVLSTILLGFSLEALAQGPAPIYEKYFPNISCREKYQDLTEGGKLETTYVHGYSDDGEGKTTYDLYYQNLLIKNLTTPCKIAGQKNCGFRRSFDDAEKFTKKIIGPSGNQINVYMIITHSSYTKDQSINNTDPKQVYQSNHAKKIFANGIKKSQVVIYDGHSRNGGGPDFTPPVTDSHGHTDYDWYQSHRGNLQTMLNNLKEGERNPKLIGLFSCSSINHFYNSVKKAAPDSGFIGTNEALLFSDTTAYTLLDDLYNFRCLDRVAFPKPVLFKKWWEMEKSYQIIGLENWKSIYEKRVLALYHGYTRAIDSESRQLFFDELDKLTYVPKSLKELAAFPSYGVNGDYSNYFMNKWSKPAFK